MDTNDQTGQGEQPDANEPAGGGSSRREQVEKARELGERWLGQLQVMIEEAAFHIHPPSVGDWVGRLM